MRLILSGAKFPVQSSQLLTNREILFTDSGNGVNNDGEMTKRGGYLLLYG
jgi:hypothetical protein